MFPRSRNGNTSKYLEERENEEKEKSEKEGKEGEDKITSTKSSHAAIESPWTSWPLPGPDDNVQAEGLHILYTDCLSFTYQILLKLNR